MSDFEVPSISYTPTTQADSILTAISNDQSQQATLEEELSTGYTVNEASDDPAMASTILGLNDSLDRADQYSTNAANGEGWLSLANSTTNSVLSDLQTAQSALESLSTYETDGQTAAITGVKTTISSVLQEVISLANTTYGDQAIFAGTSNSGEAYDSDPTSADYGSFVGGGDVPTTTVGPGVTVAKSVLGTSIFGPESVATGGVTGSDASPASTENPDEITNNLLGPNGILQTVISDLDTGTTASLEDASTNQLSYLQSAIQTVEGAAAQLGANYDNMEQLSDQATDTQTAIQDQLSDDDSVDVATASTQLTEAQQTYQSGLWAASQIEEYSLVDYLE